MVMSKKIVVRESAISGKGLYCIELIKAGEMVWEAEKGDEEKYYRTKEQIAKWSEEEQKQFMNFAYMVKPGLWSGVPPGVDSDKSEYMNHHCDANVQWEGDDSMVAARDISVGEEVTFDYATSESWESDHTPFRCGCGAGAGKCRGVITGYDMFLPAVRSRWGGAFTQLAKDLQAKYDKGEIQVPSTAGHAQ